MAKKAAAPAKGAPKKAGKPAKAAAKPASKKTSETASQPEWLQDVSIETPVPASVQFAPGQRQLEFSVGMRQIDDSGHIRSELRARAVIHAENVVLSLVEASYVNVAPKHEIRNDLPEYLYQQLKPQLEKLLAIAGHTPPLPESLEKAA